MREKVKDGKQVIIIITFAIGICIACILGLFRPGIHFIPGFMHADVKKNCYLYDSAKDEFFGESEVLIKGWGNNITKEFRGKMSVVGYEVEGDAFSPVGIFREGSIWSTYYFGVIGAAVKDEEGIEHWKIRYSDTLYRLWIDIRDSNNFVMRIENIGEENNSGDSCTFIIGADSKEMAKEAYRSIYMEGVLKLPADVKKN